jgi:hypothetical protein
MSAVAELIKAAIKASDYTIEGAHKFARQCLLVYVVTDVADEATPETFLREPTLDPFKGQSMNSPSVVKI